MTKKEVMTMTNQRTRMLICSINWINVSQVFEVSFIFSFFIRQTEPKHQKTFYITNLKGISTTSFECNFIFGYIFLYILDDIKNATQTNNMEQNIHIQTNWVEKIHKYTFWIGVYLGINLNPAEFANLRIISLSEKSK